MNKGMMPTRTDITSWYQSNFTENIVPTKPALVESSSSKKIVKKLTLKRKKNHSSELL